MKKHQGKQKNQDGFLNFVSSIITDKINLNKKSPAAISNESKKEKQEILNSDLALIS